MKRIMLALVALMAGAGYANANVTVHEARPARIEHFHAGVSVSMFYDTLSPYGDWVYVGSYGRVWRPSAAVVGVGFRPYATGGNWVYTDYGWSWESDYDWGWAPFHYGRWTLDQVYGWVWMPDTTWGPAWVDWRFGGGYVGWAPLAPYGAYVSYNAYSPWWVFVDSPHFCDYGVYRYSLPYNRIVTTAWPVTQPYRQTIGYGGTRYYAGPPASHIATAAGVAIRPVHVTAPRPGVIAQVRTQVVANPQIARSAAASPYHALAQGRVAASPQAATTRPVMPQGGVRATPVAPQRAQPVAPQRAQPVAPQRPQAFPAAPAPRAQPAMPSRPYVAPQPARPAAPQPQQYRAPQQARPMAPQPQYRAPQPARPMAPQQQQYRAPQPARPMAPQQTFRAAPAPQQMNRAAPAPRNNAAAAHPVRQR